MNTITYKSAVRYAIDNLDAPQDIIDKLIALEESIDKRSSRERKPTKEQEANAECAANIADFLSTHGAMTGAELRQTMGSLSAFTPQKVTGLLKVAEKKGLVEKYEDKRKTYWRAVEGE